MRPPGIRGAPAAARQLPLGVELSAVARLDNFVPGANADVLQTLRRMLDGGVPGHLYLHGGQGTGKTHLLQACCAAIQATGARVAYLPLAERDALSRDVVTGMETAALVCVDDIDRAAADPEWERALFNLYNEADAAGARLLFSGRAGPAGIRLPDLRSRLSAALTLSLAVPDDALRREVLARRARELGIALGGDTLDYILARQPRDLGSLTALVTALDRYALTAKRRVTIALVREFLEGRDSGP